MATLDQATAYLEKQFGAGVIMNLKGSINMNPTVSTGHPYIDYVMGGGMPYGKMVEIYGQPSAGKTTLSMVIAAMAQKKKKKTGRVWWGDYENAFDTKYFKRLGGSIEPEHLIVSQPSTAEEGMEIARVLIASDLVDLCVFDSVAAMMSFKESGDWVDSNGNITTDGKGKQQGGMGEQQIGLHARVITQGIKQLQSKITEHGVGIIWINQIRTKIGTGGRDTTETTTGGNAVKFYSAVRIEMQRVASKKGKLYDPFENKVVDDKIVAIETRVKGAKNRVAPPFREAIVTVGFGSGFDTEMDLLKMATNHKIVEKGGTGWYKTEALGASRNARGESDFRKLLKDEPKVKQALMDKLLPILDTIDENKQVVIDEDDKAVEIQNKAMEVKPVFAQPAAATSKVETADIDAALGVTDAELVAIENGGDDVVATLSAIAADLPQ